MSNTKYNWAAHMSKIDKLYMEGLSIPKIHQAICQESDGFTPSLGTLYNKLRSEEYPTDPAGRAQRIGSLNIARWPSEMVSLNAFDRNQRQELGSSFQSTGARHSDNFPRSSPSDPFDQMSSIPGTSNNISIPLNQTPQQHPSWSKLTPIAEFEQSPGYQPYSGAAAEVSNWFAADDTLNLSVRTWGLEETELIPTIWDGPDGDFSTLAAPLPETQPDTAATTDNFAPVEILRSENPNINQPDWPVSSSHEGSLDVNHTSYHSTIQTPSSDSSLSRPAIESCGDRFLPFRRLKTWNNRCPTPEKRHSAATTDSGYASGRNSPFNFLAEGGERMHPRSLTEFKGLYRFPCPRLHEPRSYSGDYMPQPTNRFKDVETCHHCHYSGIHNLSWSAKELKLQVFLAELQLDKVYSITDLDAAGNSALHYAASGGASYEHFKALIEAGVNPYQLNTNGQLFLHCLRPILQKSDSEASDPNYLLAFNLNLVNLLNYFRLTGAFRWRDNEGMTVMDRLALKVSDSHATSEIFSAVQNAGHPLEVSPRFQKATRNVKTTRWQQPSPMSDPSTPQREPDFLHNAEEKNERRQIRFRDLLHRAKTEPSYVDPETGDNALHALSCLQLPEAGSTMTILSSLRSFACKDGLDLNLQNREQESPLTALVCRGPASGMESNETEATRSKYIDTLLWKDPFQRLPNKINVNMKNRKGATALYYAAVRGRPDSVRSLIEAGANVNARLKIDGQVVSILQATLNAKEKALDLSCNDSLTIYLYENVVSYLEHENAMLDPTVFNERRVSENSVRMMPGCSRENRNV